MKVHFNYKDMFKAPRIAFRFQRLWINGIGLLVGYLIYLVFTYLSLLLDGYSFSEVWSRYGLLACSYNQLYSWYSLIIFLIGVAAFFAIFLLTNTALSRVAYMELRKEFFYTWTQAFKFAFRKWVSALGAMLTFLFMIAFFVIGALVVSFVGRIPVIGEIGNLLLIIPYLLAALLLLFIMIVTFIGIFLVPAIIATSEEDALGGVFQSFSITYNQPWRLIFYGVLTAFLEIVGMVVFAFFLKKAYLLFAGLFAVGMGEKFMRITEHGLFLIDKTVPQLYQWMQIIFGSFADQIFLSFHHAPMTLSASENIAAYIFTTFMIIVGGSVIAYGEAIRNCACTILYVNLYKIHEGDSLLEREDEELKEDSQEEKTEDTDTDAEKGGVEDDKEKKETD